MFHFTDADPAGTVGDYTAAVTLGDGHTVTLTGTASSKGQIVANSTGGFDVQLSYTYAEELSGATFAVSVADVGGAMTSQSTNTFSVADAPLSSTLNDLTPPVATEGRRSRTSPCSTSPMPIQRERWATTRPPSRWETATR